MFKTKKQNNDGDTVIGPGVKFKGTVRGNGDVRVEGTFGGEINTKGKVIVTESATVTGNITAFTADVAGQVTGNINSEAAVTLAATARVTGDINANVLNIAPGAIFTGKSQMKEEEKVGKPVLEAEEII